MNSRLNGKVKYTFSACTWQHPSPGGWIFVSLPVEMAEEIRAHLKWQEEGWGRLKAMAQIGDTKWETAIWFDTKHNTYLLPLKAEVRKKEGIEANQFTDVMVWI